MGEGPSYFVPAHNLKECFTKTGITEVVERCQAQWVLFDDCNYRTFRDLSPLLPQMFRISEHAFLYDAIINLPVPKTHYLTTVSIAMKNLKGFLKQEDKPLFHRVDLNQAVVELNKIIKPTLNLVDFTIPRQHHQGFLLAGSDIVAVDTVSSALMGLTPQKIPLLKLGYEAGLGEVNLRKISIIGEIPRDLRFTMSSPPNGLRGNFLCSRSGGMILHAVVVLFPSFHHLGNLQIREKPLKSP